MGDFSFGEFVDQLSPEVGTKLKKEHLTTLPVLLMMTEQDITALRLKRGSHILLRGKLAALQGDHGGGPLCVVQSQPQDETVLLGERLSALGLQPTKKKGEPLRIVDFVPQGLATEEEVALGGGIVLRMDKKIKLEKVSPAMWIVANAKIMAKLVGQGVPMENYLQYTTMVGEMACRFTWQSVLVFDDEYRTRQAASDFAWGTDAPHLSTVVLRDRPQQQQGHKPGGKAGVQNGRRLQAPNGKEVCLQHTNATCSFGARCKYEHCCHVCGSRDHAGRDHPGTTGAAATTPSSQ
jgi:hypothetical protein